jgi:glycosyltransferase involved in cell wall biosynthesis
VSTYITVNARFLTQVTTGVQRYAIGAVKTLDGLLHREVLKPQQYPLVLLAPKSPILHTLDLKCIEVRQVGRANGNLWGQLELPSYERENVLWSPTNTGPVFHRRHIVTIHDAAVLDHPEWFSTKFALWYRVLLPMLAQRAMRILTVSQFSRNRLIDALDVDPRRIFVVPNGVDAMFRPIEHEGIEPVLTRLDLPSDYVLTLGSLEPRKNLARLLRAWQLLLSRRAIDKKLSLVVAGGKHSSFRQTDYLPLPEHVVFTGYISDEDLPALYSGARAFVYPSLYEGFGLPPLEAMACGAPVITSASTSIPEVAGDAALLIDPADVESIADGIESVLNDVDLRNALSTASHKHAKLFTWDRSARLIWTHLTEVAAMA